MRFARFSSELTEAASFKDSRSMIGLRFDGTERIVLKGEDKRDLHAACMERDGYMCVDRGNGTVCSGPLHMSHWPAMSKSEGSDILSQVSTRCWVHHVRLDFHNSPAHF